MAAWGLLEDSLLAGGVHRGAAAAKAGAPASAASGSAASASAAGVADGAAVSLTGDKFARKRILRLNRFRQKVRRGRAHQTQTRDLKSEVKSLRLQVAALTAKCGALESDLKASQELVKELQRKGGGANRDDTSVCRAASLMRSGVLIAESLLYFMGWLLDKILLTQLSLLGK